MDENSEEKDPKESLVERVSRQPSPPLARSTSLTQFIIGIPSVGNRSRKSRMKRVENPGSKKENRHESLEEIEDSDELET